MKPDRRDPRKQAADVIVKEMQGGIGKLSRFVTPALWVLTIALLIFFVVRWRANTAERAHDSAAAAITLARTQLDSLQFGGMNQSPAQIAANRKQIETIVNQSVGQVLNDSTEPLMRAQANVARGDLYWLLANAPDLPGATTQPSLALPGKREDLLAKSEEAYKLVSDDTEMSKFPLPRASAQLGLAAIAENRDDWTKAASFYKAVQDASDVASAVRSQAGRQLLALPSLQTPLLLAASVTAPLVDTPTPLLLVSPTSLPTTMATSLPASMPALMPVTSQPSR